MKPILATLAERSQMDAAKDVHIGDIKAAQDDSKAKLGRYQTIPPKKNTPDSKLSFSTIRFTQGAEGPGYILEWSYNDGTVEWIKREVFGPASAQYLAHDWQQAIPSVIAPLLPGAGAPQS